MTPYTAAVMATLPMACHVGSDIWTARVPVISWKRVEWHLADRVMKQFGGSQSTNIQPIERTFQRIDGRGHADINWAHQHRAYIAIWNDRRSYIVEVQVPMGGGNQELTTYLRWYRSWATIYLLRPLTQPPETIYPRSPGERLVSEFYIRAREIVQPLQGGQGQNVHALQQAVDDIAELSYRVDRSVYIEYGAVDTSADIQSHSQRSCRRHTHTQGPRRSTSDATTRGAATHVGVDDFQAPRYSMYTASIGDPMPSTFEVGGPSMTWGPDSSVPGPSSQYSYDTQAMYVLSWMTPLGLPASPTEQDLLLQQGWTERATPHDQEEDITDGAAHLQGRQRRAPTRYTPGTDAIPRRRRT